MILIIYKKEVRIMNYEDELFPVLLKLTKLFIIMLDNIKPSIYGGDDDKFFLEIKKHNELNAFVKRFDYFRDDIRYHAAKALEVEIPEINSETPKNKLPDIEPLQI